MALLEGINNFLNGFSVKKRMLLSVMLFLITLGLAMKGAYESIGANITFAEQEKKGNLYQRPLADLMRDVGQLRLELAKARGGMTDMNIIGALNSSIEKSMKGLEGVQEAVGDDLQFTTEGLESRDRGNLKLANVQKKWAVLQRDIVADPSAAAHDEAVASYIADIRGMIAHSGDTSNLILDPDLDSYYLMDITLLALPQNLDRLTVIAATLYPQLAPGYVMSADEKTKAAVMAHSLKESDMDRVAADVDVALKEDANFYEVSEGLQKNMPLLMKEYSAKTTALIDLLNNVSSGAPVTQDDLVTAFKEAQARAYKFLDTGFDDLDVLLDKRIAAYKAQQILSLETSVAGIIISMLFFLLVLRSLTGPLEKLTESMHLVANNHLELDIPYIGVRSEIGNMAASIQVFKQNAIDKTNLEKSQKAAEERTKAERKKEMRELAENFESRIKGVIDAVSSAASGLSTTATDLSHFVEQSTKTAQDTSTSADAMSKNVQSVAASAEEMSVTIQNISQQIQATNRFISQSVEKVAGADIFAESLKGASQKVKEVTNLISEIAAQTNLLALNATIEAARAGEAGRGFAVVATEVKTLASQTDKSIQDIEKVIHDMSNASDGVLASLVEIKGAVDKIFETSSGIASAVEEQSVTVNSIVQSMQTASDGTLVVSKNIQTVSKLSDDAAASSRQVQVAANDLSSQAQRLDAEVGAFLSEIRI